jgi:lysosomal acid lipase/cholesteryl ester hydrolase
MPISSTMEQFVFANVYLYTTVYLLQSDPPIYNMNGVNAPTYLYWSDADWLADRRDITGYLLPNLNPTILIQNTNLHDFNHLDFIWGLRAAPEIYNPIIDIIRRDANMTTK